jgi:hemoglobin
MEKTIYETIGGAPTVCKVVAVFYEKILGDDSVNHFFQKIDMAKQLQ